jgi:hypothetical protein
MEIKNSPVTQQVEEMDKVYDVSRRRFFQLAGGFAGAGLLLAACKKTSSPSTRTYLGQGDIALLNFFYVIQQLEAAFYTQAVATPYYGLDVYESQLLTDVRDQEIAHREYLKGLLSSNAISDIIVNFSAVTFADRSSVLKYAAIIEDLAVSAFNGSAHLYLNKDYVYALSKIVSVEARHSAYFRDLLANNSFADNTAVNTYGLDLADTPANVLLNAEAFIQTKFDSSKLPN